MGLASCDGGRLEWRPLQRRYLHGQDFAAQGALRICVFRMRRRPQQMAGTVRRLRRMELAERDRAGARRKTGGRATRRVGRQRRSADGDRAQGRAAQRTRARVHRHRRVRSSARRRAGGRGGGAGRWRSGHRQVDVAAAGHRADGIDAAWAVRHRRGIARTGGRSCVAARPAGRRRACAGRNRRRTHPRTRFVDAPESHRRRFGADVVDRATHRRAGFGQPGTRIGCAPRALRQGNRNRGIPRRPCHQGRRHRRAARARTHGRCGAVFRRRERQPLPGAARVQEPLRRGERTRRVRDGREGVEGSRRIRRRSSCPAAARRSRAAA